MDQGIEVQKVQANKIINTLESRLGDKQLDSTERRAVGFVIDRNNSISVSPEEFIGTTLGVIDTDTPAEVSWKTFETVHKTAVAEIARRTEENIQNPEEVRKLQIIGEIFTDRYNRAVQEMQENPEKPIRIGGIPGYWLPDWAK